VESIRIKNISETDFDGIVHAAGGARIASEGSADYRLGEAVVELKLIQEEGFEKASRQEKLARLFRTQQPNSPVVVLDPKTLDAAKSRRYYNIVEGPIKTLVKKADKQLQTTAQRFTPEPTRVLVIINLGYTALDPDEFQSVCLKCVHNDTNKIDFLVCGGIYFHSDKFDNYLFARFEPIAVNLARPFPSYDPLANAWGSFVEGVATSMIREKVPPEKGRLPVIDLSFDMDGVRYVKPAPGVPSNFYPSGHAPRENTSGIEKCPPVARVLPGLKHHDWEQFRQALANTHSLKNSYPDYLAFLKQVDSEESEAIKPIVPFPITFADFSAHASGALQDCRFSDLCAFATARFDEAIRAIIDRTKDMQHTVVLPLEYLLVTIQQIGSDEVNDLASLYHVRDTPGFQRTETIFENERLFLHYAIVLAASYAVKRHLDWVLYSRKSIRP
jgi:hypothetical protein